MRLALSNVDKIVGIVSDTYLGPLRTLDAPLGFDINRISEYVVKNDSIYIPEPSVQEVKDIAVKSIKEQAQLFYLASVTDTNGTIWRGGMDSATSIKNGIEMAEFLGATEITLRDINFDPHVMNMTDARTVAATIGLAWQRVFQAEEEAKRQLNLVDLESPTAIDDLLAIDINNYLV